MTKKQIVIGTVLWCSLISIVLAIPYLPYDSKREVRVEFLDETGSDTAYVFFGFTSCADVCPTTLGILRNILSQQDSFDVLPQVAFVDIDLQSTADMAKNYATQFHPNFIGHFPEGAELSSLIADFGLNIKQNNGAISHAGQTYLLQRENNKWWRVKTFNPQSISEPILRQAIIK
jgi:cytochrome oxidase Cu insertion factor (SCO1/SenC/PrrC family)